MKINEHQLNWFLKATDSSLDDLIAWLKKWDTAKGYRTDLPCISSNVGPYCGMSIKTKVGRRDVWGTEARFNDKAKLVDNLTLWDLAAEFRRDSVFRKRLIQALKQLKKERKSK